MTPALIAMLRAYLLIASLTAAAIQTMALLSVALFGVSEAVFVSLPFRVAAALTIIATVLVVKQIARVAFLSALSHEHATITDTPSRTTRVSAVCPVRALVVLHLRLSRRQIEWATA
ncbi:hypothetical protein [Paraburkholderia sp. DHOC27]|uniref:hypothetical protein n=1 Tax=Paraburkholderia sp. DHOC27 TaxID=2303330 RepID=UPI0011C19523|nr:hypothetical protein [Paraburkholderia sp. DHOC27]